MLQNKVSYGYYFNDYSMGHSPVLDEERFEVYEARARQFLKSLSVSEIPRDNLDDVFACICALAEELYSQKDSKVKSESVDGYSVTFAADKNAQKDLYAIANLYLGHLGILYAGVK